MTAQRSNESYYDEFSDWYERERHHGYHALVDDLEYDLVADLAKGRDVLDVGCGTGLILRRVASDARLAVGVDLSPGMLSHAVRRGLPVARASVTHLPFADETFDLVYSFKVLSHVQDVARTLRELSRVTRPGGDLLLEYYNARSLRYWAKRAWSGRISKQTDESAVYTRFDTIDSLAQQLPPELTLSRVSGVRVFTPHSIVHRIPAIRRVFRWAEWRARDSRLGRFGGFLVLHLRKEGVA